MKTNFNPHKQKLKRLYSKKVFILISLLICTLVLTSPVTAKVFVTDTSHGIMTAPAASYTGNELILSSTTPEKAVKNYLSGQSTIVVGNLNIGGTKISARTSTLAKYWTKSNVVILTTGNDVSATYLAIKYKAPILISGKTMPAATKSEIIRLKPKTIIICASTSSIPTSSLKYFKSANKVRRWHGSDRATLLAVQKSWPSKTKITAPKSLLPVAMNLWKTANFDISSSSKVTINGSTSIWSSNTAITSIAMNRNAKKTLPTIYITSDKLSSSSADKAFLAKIKSAVSGSAKVVIDPNSPAPGEASRSIKNAPSGSIAAYIAAACPGLMYDVVTGVKIGYLKTSAAKLKGIVYVNYGNLNLGSTSYLNRAWDDNFSNVYFAGLYTPSKYLSNSGIKVIEPKIGTTTESQRINKIASGLIYYAYTSNKEHTSTTTYSSMVAKHQIDPTTLSTNAQQILNNQANSMNRGKWLYLTSQYISGTPITTTSDSMTVATSSSSTYSGTLTRAEYKYVAKKVHEFMKTNKRAPNFVDVNGKKLSINDYTKLFAQITSKHTAKKSMNFPATVTLNTSLIDQVIEAMNQIGNLVSS
ncbi:cell wall-binding repeat-containing protein [Methanobacterium alcaliphilum]|uniref:cell wall-binding repeat-containing protein n=1 Tax=Methanobacterium alcaliphilum TaxID=392018 RepID=UPI00200B0A43|nr:pseudomurein-binding repeat-containing protein [Methanobacterium alcaliphilum]MCK9150916.1 pseudomurein-binding protein [Methanobacterium alcaliphilum]